MRNTLIFLTFLATLLPAAALADSCTDNCATTAQRCANGKATAAEKQACINQGATCARNCGVISSPPAGKK